MSLMLGLFAWCVVGIPASSFGQTIQFTQNKPDQTTSGSARVDPTTLGMSFSIPLGGYPGRGAASLPVTLNYSSKLWRIKFQGPYKVGAATRSQAWAQYGENSAAGWTTTLAVPRLEWPNMEEVYDFYGQPVCMMPDCPDATFIAKYYINHVHVHMPDGSAHELRKDNPVVIDHADNSGTYYAVDDSRLRYVKENNTLYLADGSRYVLGSPTQYIDANGNTLTYSSNQWTDTLGRTVGVPVLGSAPDAGDYPYSMAGVGGASLTYTFRWRSLEDARTDPSQALRYVGDRLINSPSTVLSPALYTSAAGGSVMSDNATFNPIVLSEIVLPNGQSYKFTYNVWGEMDKVTYPTGGYERYQYDKVRATSHLEGLYEQSNRGVTSRWVSPSGTGTDEAQWQYTAAYADTSWAQPFKVTESAPDGTRTERLVYTGGFSAPAFGFDDARVGMLYDERTFAPAAQSGAMLRRSLTEWAEDTRGYGETRNARAVKQVSILLDTGGNALAATTVNRYEQASQPLNLTSTTQYDYAAVDQSTAQNSPVSSFNPSDALAVRTTETTYMQDASYTARNLVALPISSRVRAGTPAGAIVAQSEMRYDEAGYPLLPCGAGVGWNDPGTGARGLVTTSRSWLNTTGGWLETHAQYDGCGSVWNSWDARGNLSQVEYSSAYYYAYPTLARSPAPDPTAQYGSNSPLVTTTNYDFSTGRVTSQTDANNQTTSFEYNDSLNRRTRIVLAQGTASASQTTFSYDDANHLVTTTSDLNAYGDNLLKSQTVYDGLGRAVESRQYESSVNYTLTRQNYDASGRAGQSSNPYRPWQGQSPVWTTTQYDALGRVRTVTTPDGAVLTTAYSGNMVTVTDQAGKSRRSLTNALGRLVRVDEPDSNGNLGAASSPAQPTLYSYDALGNLRKVEQGAQQRFFMYDSLGRLMRAKNPEQATNAALALSDSVTGNSQWSLAYAYDANGNLQTRTDARVVVATYAYDNLNRNTTVRYSDGTTKDIDRHYDGAINGRGRFHYFNWDTANNSRFDTHLAIDEYDATGRPKKYRQHFLTNGAASAPFTVERTYNLAGQVTTQIYPSGRSVAYHYDVAGHADSFTGNVGDGVARSYATGITYDATGGVQQEQFGTQTPLYHKLHRNVRGQLNDVRLSTVAWQTDQWNWNRGALVNYYASADLSCQTEACRAGSGADNNGNLLRAETYIPADEQASSYAYFQSRYEYDSLNRLRSVAEYQGGQWGAGGQSFAQTYVYDRYGNRMIDQDPAKTWGVGVPKPQFTVDAATNRLGVPAGQSGALTYDAAGNLNADSYTSFGARTYDAENRMSAAQDSWQSWSYYTYDADGHRVKRKTRGQEVWQVYGIDGELLAEYAAGAAPFVASKEYGYRGGELLMTISSGDEGRLSRFVSNLYDGALQRDPSAQESQEKKNQLTDAGAQGLSQLTSTAQQMARGLFQSTNYDRTNNRTDEQYVSDLYYTYLQRAPDSSGLAWWMGQVASTSRESVCTAFESSSEFQTLVNTLYGTATSDDERTERFIRNLYLAANGAEPTATELQQQRDRLNNAAAQGQTRVQSEAEALGRELFASQVTDSASAQPTRDYVTNLYEGFLQRGPDAGGLDFWTAQAGGGATNRQSVLNAFATSTAFRELAARLYREVNWVVSDHLGTPRMVADKSGSLSGIKRHDYLPFGEEVSTGIGGRTPQQGYTGDSLRQKFTTYERDAETNLDYAQARYFSSGQGRFTSVDPLVASSRVNSPQTWNRYSYGLNNPLRFNDPAGLAPQDQSTGGHQGAEQERHLPLLPTQPEIYPIANPLIPTRASTSGPIVTNTDPAPAFIPLEDARPLAEEALELPSCRQFIFPSGQGLPTLRRLFSTGSIRIADASVMTNVNGEQKRLIDTADTAKVIDGKVYINAYAPDWSQSVEQRRGTQFAGLNLLWVTTLTLLHEDAHMTGDFGPDVFGNDSTQSLVNTLTVRSKCIIPLMQKKQGK